jgi:cytochrome c biogenesis protein CcdA
VKLGISDGLISGLVATAGAAAVFAILGLPASVFLMSIGPYAPWIGIVVGVCLILVGIFLAAETHLSFHLPVRLPISSRGRFGLFLFGAAYAGASIACVFPVFLMVVAAAAATGGLLTGALIFTAYSAGMGMLMVLVTVATATSRTLLLKRFGALTNYTRKTTSLLLVLAGLYIIYLQGWVLSL